MRRPHARGPGYAKSAFRYDAQRDAYICPHGQTLPFERTRRWRGKHESRVYRCAAPDCPRRGECTRDRRGRAVEREPFPEAMERQRRRQEREENRLLMRRRGEIAELPFARVKHLMEFRRWTARGLRNARAQWAVLCTTLNLKVLYGLWRTGRLPASALSG